MTEPPRVVDVLPDLGRDIERELREQHVELADQVGDLRIVERCPCADDFCASFYTGPRPNGAWGPRHETVAVSANLDRAMLTLDVVDGVIRYVEILYSPEVGRRLDEAGFTAGS